LCALAWTLTPAVQVRAFPLLVWDQPDFLPARTKREMSRRRSSVGGTAGWLRRSHRDCDSRPGLPFVAVLWSRPASLYHQDRLHCDETSLAPHVSSELRHLRGSERTEWVGDNFRFLKRDTASCETQDHFRFLKRDSEIWTGSEIARLLTTYVRSLIPPSSSPTGGHEFNSAEERIT
jgi:hypothetical protein